MRALAVSHTSPALSDPALEVRRLEAEIDRVDADLVKLIQARNEAVRQCAAAARQAGQPRVSQRHELSAIRRFDNVLGRDGVAFAMTLLRLARTVTSTVSAA